MVSSSGGTIAQPLLLIFDVFVGAFQFVGCFRQIEYPRTLFRMDCIPSMHTASQTLSGYDLLCTWLKFQVLHSTETTLTNTRNDIFLATQKHGLSTVQVFQFID